MFSVQKCTCGAFGGKLLLMLAEYINCYVCDVQKKYIPLILVTAYRAAGLRVKRLQDNIETDIKEMALMITRTENNISNTYSQYRHFHSRHLVQTMNTLPSSVRPLCTYTFVTACSCSVMQPPHNTAVHKIV